MSDGVSVVVPVFGGGDSLDALVGALEPVLRAAEDEFELLLVEDGGPGDSAPAIAAAAAGRAWVRTHALPARVGQHNALLFGIRRARHGVVVTMDDDLQHPPGELPRLLAALDGAQDLVYGTPPAAREGLARRLGSRGVRALLRLLSGVRGAADASSFRAFRTELRDAFAGHESRFTCLDVLLLRATDRVATVDVERPPRPRGRTGYDLPRLVVLAFSVLVCARSSAPGRTGRAASARARR